MLKPKAILFDIGGVCVVSPFEAIVEYETKNNIPKDWVNFSIARSSPNGAWQRLERGEIKMDDQFFDGFKRDLHNPKLWEQYHLYFKNRKSRKDPNQPQRKPQAAPEAIPPLPTIDTTALFWDMMARSRHPDPHMSPALLNLKQSQQYIVAALSNTVIFPPDHEYSKTWSRDIQSQFDVFVSSAHVGLRKPDPKIYQHTLESLDKYDRSKGGDGVRADQIVFLDDIGSNLKAAREAGFRTIKVNLGRVDEAVVELEKVTGLTLAAAGSKSRL